MAYYVPMLHGFDESVFPEWSTADSMCTRPPRLAGVTASLLTWISEVARGTRDDGAAAHGVLEDIG